MCRTCRCFTANKRPVPAARQDAVPYSTPQASPLLRWRDQWGAHRSLPIEAHRCHTSLQTGARFDYCPENHLTISKTIGYPFAKNSSTAYHHEPAAGVAPPGKLSVIRVNGPHLRLPLQRYPGISTAKRSDWLTNGQKLGLLLCAGGAAPLEHDHSQNATECNWRLRVGPDQRMAGFLPSTQPKDVTKNNLGEINAT